ncbi:ATP-binding protein [Ferribacterium limneticum]|uniref:ATP-binding protein n=1 Tax=Ferribacterium limneticum TaxID=76259 RepID=UPI001CFB0F71|nr:ATP-binding protein [Ferribacterium limneticum]UCV28151.1 AAA family ATPase [Ferribacterium limneticum]UCV32068.1 AAA family ATPase [Ferribacterium limneticum]
MNIFVAGVHGVGKTYLASKLPPDFGLLHTSASKLIKEEREMPEWGSDKRVGDVDANQIALATAVKRYNDAGTRLLLDGHFVLLNKEGEFTPLSPDVFRSLNLNAAVLIEADPHTIAMRIRKRDEREIDIGETGKFIEAERTQAQAVCHALGIPLHTLNTPSADIFAETISATVSKPAGGK